MAMNWLKGLVAPAAQFPGGPQQPPPADAPPIGGAPQGSPYGVQPGMQPAMQPAMQPQTGQPSYDASGFQSPMQWSTGTRTQGAALGISGHGISGQGGAGTARAGAGETLEQKCARLQNDVESLALFARTLLTMLEESKVVTREQFDATKQRLDMLDGKLDDR